MVIAGFLTTSVCCPIILSKSSKAFFLNSTIRLAGQGLLVTQADRDRKLFKVSMVLNVVIMNIFFLLNFLTNFGNRNIELTAIYYVVFAVSLILANFLVYQYFKKQTI
jgi:hypothetical protein